MYYSIIYFVSYVIFYVCSLWALNIQLFAVIMGQWLKLLRANLLYFITQLHIGLCFLLTYRVALVMMDLLAALVFLVLR